MLFSEGRVQSRWSHSGSGFRGRSSGRVKRERNLYRKHLKLISLRWQDTQERYYPKCFAVESLIRDAGGFCLSCCSLPLFLTLLPSQRSPDGWRTRTLKVTTPVCGSNVEAATINGTASLSWSSVSTLLQQLNPSL